MINNLLKEFQDNTGIHRLPNTPKLTFTNYHHSVPRSLPKIPISQPNPTPLPPKKRTSHFSLDHPDLSSLDERLD